MRSNMTIYEGGFVNTETNVDNENIQQLVVVRLFDTETVTADAHNTLYRVVSNGDGTQNVFITWTPTGAAASFGYNNGAWVDTAIDLSGSAIITIPEGDYTYSILVDAVRSELSEGETIELEMAEEPLRISVIDNDEDKFTAIRSKQAEIKIHSSDQVDISDFADGGDNRWYVEIETQAEGIIFKGFLSISDLEQEFLPDPNIILLTATDGLGFLNDEPLVNFDNETPIGVYPIINFLAWALAKTGLSLDIKACMNIRERYAVPLVSDDSGAGHFYTHEYIDAKTFEAEIGTCEDCFTVLEKILGENSFLTQYNGKWIILRIDELETGHEYYFTRFDHTGAWVENTLETYTKDIGVDLALSFMNDDALVSLERPNRKAELTYKYNYPEEIVCNIDFSRGITVITEPDLSAANSTGTYEVECWTMRRISGAITSTMFIEKTFELGYEKNRYLVITPKSDTATPYDFAQSEPIEISQGDKIEFSVDFRFRTNFSASAATYFPCLIWIEDENGDRYYWYNSSTPIDITTFHWVFRASGSGEANFYMPANVQSDYDETEWTTVSSSLDAAPVSGRLFIGLIQLHQGIDPGDNQDGFFSNLEIDIRPKINGSYQRYTGQLHSVTQDNDKIKAIREKEVFISDAPRIAMKGALLKEGASPGVYVLTEGFYNAAKLTAGPSAESDISPFGQIQSFDVWNQINRVMRTFEGTIDRTDSDSELPDLLHKYILRDISGNTADGLEQYRIFQLLHFEMDMHLCEWDSFFTEVFNTDNEKVYEGHEFKYLTNE